MKQKVFNKVMINKIIEVIFIDEVFILIMEIDDWKILIQGGYIVVDVKYQIVKLFINWCFMLLIV